MTIWRDSCAATMKRRGPSLPSNSAPRGSWDGLQSAFQSTWSQSARISWEQRKAPGRPLLRELDSEGGEKGFLSGQVYHYNLILWKFKRPGDIIFCLCRCLKVFSPMKKTTSPPPCLSPFRVIVLPSVYIFRKMSPRRVCRQVPCVMCLVCEGFLCDTDCSHLL